MNLRVDIYSCNGCGQAIVSEENEDIAVCPYKGCESYDFEYSHSGHVVND
ncbi:hypothetical protein [Mesobacillus stamsii]|uniref:Uncharacterized protein n=1 Tax=Mesobacillus stamsii TaxID=225347 RepID=A0ABU0FS21_9BACI|nr:hypothetical protein [Mesobacillus stamsii]MDQ0412701.1 hypothetical protein [Mesobacillus stamsii]